MNERDGVKRSAQSLGWKVFGGEGGTVERRNEKDRQDGNGKSGTNWRTKGEKKSNKSSKSETTE